MTLTLKNLQKLKKKYSVAGTGTKHNIADILWKVSGSSMSSKDIQDILYLLDKKSQKDAKNLLQERENKPISNYRGMWKPRPKPLSKMKKVELIKHIKSFAKAWTKITTNTSGLGDLDDLKDHNVEFLRGLLKFYYSNEAKLLAENWLRNYKKK